MTPDIISTIVGLTEDDGLKRRATNLAGEGIDAVSNVFRSNKDRGNKDNNDNSSASGITNKGAGAGIMESKSGDNKREMLDVPPPNKGKPGKNGGTKDACGAGC